MSVERERITTSDGTKITEVDSKVGFFGTNFSLFKASVPKMGKNYATNTYTLQTKDGEKPMQIDQAESLTQLEENLTRRQRLAERVQALYASLGVTAGLGAVFALLASNLRDVPQMILALGLTITTALFYKKLDRAMIIALETKDKITFL